MTIQEALPVTGSPATSIRFGRHLVDRIEERDVDLMLLEEVSCESGFQKLIADAALDPSCGWTFVEAANSISTVSHGESDLVAIFQAGNRITAIMVENKIAANFMHEQADRYRRRGERGIADGHWTEYVTVLMAPRRYLTADLHGHVFDRHLAYEDLLAWFRRDDAGRRGAWRAALLERACGGSKSTVYKRVVDEATTAFFIDYWGIAARNYPALRMKALTQALGLRGHNRPNWSCCHIWGVDDATYASTNVIVQDPRYYSCVANMVLLPSPLKAFTDVMPEG